MIESHAGCGATESVTITSIAASALASIAASLVDPSSGACGISQ